MKTLIIAILAAVSFNAFALRCGNSLIEIGDPIGKVQEYCLIDHEYRVNNQNADILKVYIKEGGATNELIFIDGALTEINFSRF